MTEIMELKEKHFKTAIINMIKKSNGKHHEEVRNGWYKKEPNGTFKTEK